MSPKRSRKCFCARKRGKRRESTAVTGATPKVEATTVSERLWKCWSAEFSRPEDAAAVAHRDVLINDLGDKNSSYFCECVCVCVCACLCVMTSVFQQPLHKFAASNGEIIQAGSGQTLNYSLQN